MVVRTLAEGRWHNPNSCVLPHVVHPSMSLLVYKVKYREWRRVGELKIKNVRLFVMFLILSLSSYSLYYHISPLLFKNEHFIDLGIEGHVAVVMLVSSLTYDLHL